MGLLSEGLLNEATFSFGILNPMQKIPNSFNAAFY